MDLSKLDTESLDGALQWLGSLSRLTGETDDPTDLLLLDSPMTSQDLRDFTTDQGVKHLRIWADALRDGAPAPAVLTATFSTGMIAGVLATLRVLDEEVDDRG